MPGLKNRAAPDPDMTQTSWLKKLKPSSGPVPTNRMFCTIWTVLNTCENSQDRISQDTYRIAEIK